MSRIGKQVISIPEGVKVSFENGVLHVSGPKGATTRNITTDISVDLKEGSIQFKPATDSRQAKALWGTYASHARNMVEGVTKGHEKSLIIEGVGYKAEKKEKDVVLIVGYSHPVNLTIPEGLEVEVQKNAIKIVGADKETVGAFAAEIRKVRKPEPYKGKGIRYSDEVIRRKQGKRAAT